MSTLASVAAELIGSAQLFPFMSKGTANPDTVVSSGIYKTEGAGGLPTVEQPYGILIVFGCESNKYVQLWFCPNAVNVGVWWRACFGPSKTSWIQF